MKTLHLTLKKKWFDMILSGEKKEEYREIKPYWVSRLIEVDYPEETKGDNKTVPDDIVFDLCNNPHLGNEILHDYFSSFKHYDTVTFKNGYAADAPEMTVELISINFDFGKSNWGAEIGKKYITLSLGEIISTNNLKP